MVRGALFLFTICWIGFVIADIETRYNSWNDMGFSVSSEIEGDSSCQHDNDCLHVSGAPYCFNNTCSECVPPPYFSNSKCMCPPAHYCVASPGGPVPVGFCSKYEQSIIGRNCDSTMNDDPYSLVKGVNDTAFCGLLVFNDSTHEVTGVTWEGSCVAGICRQCHQWFCPSLPYSICNDGRTCRNYEEVYAPVGVLSLNYVNDTPPTLGLVLVFFIMVICSVVGFFGSLCLFYFFCSFARKLGMGPRDILHWLADHLV